MLDSSNATSNYLRIAFVPLAVGINLGIGAIVQTLKLPIFLDSIGTIITALIFGWRLGAVAGVLGFVITSATIFPPAIYFSLTQICIAAFTQLAGQYGGFKNTVRTIRSGIVLAFLAALVSAPVIYYLFGGITGNGISLLTLYLQGVGMRKASAVLISGFISEIIDKVSQCLIALFILRSLPKSVLLNFKNKTLEINNIYDRK